jgi:type 1 fimbria pilin
MKKAIIASIASVIALTMGAGVAHAANNANAGTIDLNFSGTVSTTTCALEPEVGGKNGIMGIQLGQTDKNTKGADIEVVFKPTAAAANACSGTSNFVMQWNGVGAAFDSHGLKASGGAATDSYVLVKATNAQTNNNQQVNADGFQYEFAKDKVTGEGMKYTMNLMGGAEVGDMTAAAQVKHWYK